MSLTTSLRLAANVARTASLRAAVRPTMVVAQARFLNVDRNDVESRILAILKDFKAIENKDLITLDAHFVTDLGLDSLDAVEIVMAVENEFAVEISDAEAEKIVTGSQAADFIVDNA